MRYITASSIGRLELRQSKQYGIWELWHEESLRAGPFVTAEDAAEAVAEHRTGWDMFDRLGKVTATTLEDWQPTF